MSNPGMSKPPGGSGDAVGAGALPCISIPGMYVGIPARAEGVDLVESIMTTTTLATATARTTAEMTIRRIPFKLFTVVLFPKSSSSAGRIRKTRIREFSEIFLGSAPRDSPRSSMKVL